MQFGRSIVVLLFIGVCVPWSAAQDTATSREAAIKEFLNNIDTLSRDAAAFEAVLQNLPASIADGITDQSGAFAAAAAVLEANCLECHKPGKTRGGLDLGSQASMLAGGENGPVVLPGDAANSLLIKVVRHEAEPAMPHKRDKLDAASIAALEAWINAGAPYDAPLVEAAAKEEGLQVTDADRAFWSFRPLSKTAPPDVESDWVRTPVDQYILSSLEAKNMAPNDAADRRVLIRRAYFDLWGLPPTPEEVEAFVNDEDPQAWEKLVDRLLSNAHYGERWGRHWLDLARYADSGGYEFDVERPHAYPYRDFVIKALNEDMPFDQFVQWQVAGDEYAPDNPQAIAATGFLVAGPTISNQETEKNFYDEIDDMLSTTGSAVLGLTVSCARCHDHKYDPVPQKDYYTMLSVFSPMKRGDRYMAPRAEAQAYREAKAAWDEKLTAAKVRLEEFLAPLREPLRNVKIDGLELNDAQKALLRAPVEEGNEEQKKLREQFKDQIAVSDEEIRSHSDAEANAQWDVLAQAIQQIEGEQPKEPQKVYALTDKSAEPAESYLLARGDPNFKKETVTPAYLSVLPGTDSPEFKAANFKPEDAQTTYRRTAFAEWLTDVDKGAGRLTARVIANRLWHYHFGRGLVRTPSDFGMQGDRPSHPELLDWLALELIDNGWSLKHLHRVIMNSAVYRQDVLFDEARNAADPDNRLWWRREPVRLEAEIIRDSMMAVSGVFNDKMFGPGIYPFMHPDAIATGSTSKWPKDAKDGPDTWRRSIYIFARRSARMPMMETFDQPDTVISCARRPATTIPSQALALMNSHFTTDQAKHFAKRLVEECGEDVNAHIDRAFRLALGRGPSESERAASLAFVEKQTALHEGADAARLALEDFCQVMFSVNEFVYID